MKHTVSGNNFHGNYSLTFIGHPEGFDLTPAQAKRWDRANCGMADCRCGGGYGAGPDKGSARIETKLCGFGQDQLVLIPAVRP